MPRTETTEQKDARIVEQKAIGRSRARFGVIVGFLSVALGLFFFIPSTSMLTQSQQATGTIISHVEQGSGRDARSFTTVEYNGKQYKSNQMHYRNAMGLGKAQDTVKLSILPNGGVEITKAIKKSQITGIVAGLFGMLVLTIGWFFGWKPYFEEKKSFRPEHDSKHEK